MTNGDYIRSLNNNELSELLEFCCYCSLKENDKCDGKCREHIKEWLEYERKNEQMIESLATTLRNCFLNVLHDKKVVNMIKKELEKQGIIRYSEREIMDILENAIDNEVFY